MPNFDKRGPDGIGITGRGRGICEHIRGDLLRGRRRGHLRHLSRWNEFGGDLSVQEKKSVLELEMNYLEKKLEMISNRLEELEDEKEIQ